MIVSAIVAVSENGVIGRNNKMPWHLPADLKYFKETTLYHHVIMGRRSFEAIGRPLPKRQNCIISRNPDYLIPKNCLLFSDIMHALHYAHSCGEVEAFIIGGGEIYRHSELLWDRLYLTKVHAQLEGDVYFPQLNWEEWNLQYRKEYKADEQNEYDYTIECYDRRNFNNHKKLKNTAALLKL